MTAAERIARKVRPELDAANAAADLPTAHRHIDKALALLAPYAKRGKRKGLAPGATKDSRRLERNIRLKVAYEVAENRAAGRCEVCLRLGFVLQAHHLVSGGLRRHRESAETIVMICADDHRAIHRNDLDALRAVKEACIRLGLREGLKAIERRIAKVEEARRG